MIKVVILHSPNPTSLDLQGVAQSGSALYGRMRSHLRLGLAAMMSSHTPHLLYYLCVARTFHFSILFSSPSSHRAHRQANMQLENGKTYKVTNAKGGTVLDLSGGQEQSPITGYNFSGGDNQKVRTSHRHP